MNSNFLRAEGDRVFIAIKVQPRASKNEIAKPLGNELKIKVTAPPVDAAANQALLQFLAEKLHCPRSAVQLVRGERSRHKLLCIRGLSAETVLRRLLD